MRTVAVILLAFCLVACGDDDDAGPSSGDVVIKMTFDASNAPDIVGTAEVTEGSDVLGCEQATALRTATPDDPEGRAIDGFTATCEEGQRSGTFDIAMTFEDIDLGTWEVTATAGDFDALTGGGDFSVDAETSDQATTLTGSVSYEGS